jgi:Ser/Thr protein kinase RdoA (MazF antagonist)
MVQRLDPLQTAPPPLELDGARQVLRDRFGMEGSLTPLAGERDQTFRADAGAGRRFVLKISNLADDRPILEMQAAALRHIELVDPGLPVMRAVPAAGDRGPKFGDPTAGFTGGGCLHSSLAR